MRGGTFPRRRSETTRAKNNEALVRSVPEDAMDVTRWNIAQGCAGDVVVTLARELQARREARARIVDLDATGARPRQ